MRRITAAIAAAILAVLGATAYARAAIPEGCPPMYGGSWNGGYQASNGVAGGVIATMEADTDALTLTGQMQVGGIAGLGLFVGQVDCTAIAGTTTFDDGTVSTFEGVVAEDGNTISGTFVYEAFGLTGTWQIGIAAEEEAASSGDTTIIEGDPAPGDPGPAVALAATNAKTTKAAKAPKPAKLKKTDYRTAVLALTLTAPSKKRVTVEYRLVPGTAQPNVDYVDDGKIHKVVFPANVVQRNIQVRVLANRVDQPNRSFTVRIVSVSNGAIPYAPDGRVTIVDDD